MVKARSAVFHEAVKADLGHALKSQGQMTAYLVVLDAFQAVAEAVLTGNREAETQAWQALQTGKEVLRLSTRLTDQLHEVPEASQKAEANQFREPPKEFLETHHAQTLLKEIQDLGSYHAAKAWYDTPENKAKLSRVQDPTLRNQLYDAIRDKLR